MLVKGTHYKTIWFKDVEGCVVEIIDQRFLPHQFVTEELRSVDEVARAIEDMHVRGAPLIGTTGAFGMVLACAESEGEFLKNVKKAAERLKATRPTAVNLAWGVERMLGLIESCESCEEAFRVAKKEAEAIAQEESDYCRKIGEYGVELVEEISKKKNGERVNVLTHCNAGWLAGVDWGMATSPMYVAKEKGIDVHVWVDETRPRNQGASLTAWELLENGIPHTVIADNTGGHLMQHGMVDLVIVGTDRTARSGDVANKIGTYLKALAAADNDVPFYVTLTSSAFDWKIRDGVNEIPIEERSPDEVRKIQGLYEGKLVEVLLTPENSPALNYGFDVTPARLVTGLITERGICPASEEGILTLYPEKK